MAEGSRTRKDIKQELIVNTLKERGYCQDLEASPKAASCHAIGVRNQWNPSAASELTSDVMWSWELGR